ncbi:FtsX-like permease family protein [Streptomyces sp. NPDC052236]|uniref:FtsX-like permease family protein n=1 Tax=Streptomyces sp. NPDC052236 TaxID=3365686 RepID=UPI0037CF306E
MNMTGLALRTLRFRKGGFLATFVALFFGTAIVLACGGLLETGIRNNVPPERFAGAALVVTGDRSYELHPGNEDDSEQVVLAEGVPLDAALAGRVRGVAGVERVVGDVTFAATVVDGGTQIRAQGHGWGSASLTPYELERGTAPGNAGQLVLDAATAAASGVGVGDSVRVAARGETASYKVSGVARARGAVGQRAMFFAEGEALRLAGAGAGAGGSVPGAADAAGASGAAHFDALAVVVRSGVPVSQVKAAVSEALAGADAQATVLSGDDRGLAEYPAAMDRREDLISLAGVFGGMAVMVALFVTAGTMSISAAQRRRELALMRAIGATPRQLRRMLVAETLLIAVAAALLAWLPGRWLGEALFEQLAAAGVTAPAVEFSQGWIPLVAAGGAVLITAVGAGLIGSRHAVRTRPTEALAEAALQQRWFSKIRLLFAVIFLGGAAALAIVTWTVMHGPIAASTAGPTVICAAIGLALIAPGLTKVCAALLHRPVSALTGMAGDLAMVNSRARTVQVAASVSPVMLAVAVATANMYLLTTQSDLTERAFTENLRADAVLVSASGTVAPSLVDQVSALPGVAAASAYVTSTGFIERSDGRGAETGDDGLTLQGVSAAGAAGTSAVSVTAGSLGELRGDTVALPEGAGHEVGETISLRFGDNGTARVRVVATYRPKAGGEAALLPAELLAPHTSGGLPQQILVRTEPGVAGADVTAALRELVEDKPGLAVADRDALIAAHSQDTETQAWVNYLLIGMIVAYTAVSVVNSLATATGGRRREFGLQRLTGATKAQVMRMVTVEGLVVAAIGVLLGTAAAATTLLPFAHAATDSRLPSGPLWIYGTVVATALTLTLSATLIPAWRALKVQPVRAARAE